MWIALGGLIFTIFAASWGASWALSGKMDTNRIVVLKQLKETETEHRKEFDSIWTRINANDRDLRLLLDAFSARAAEPIHAIREKISAMELDLYKHFVSQREYDKDQARILIEMKGMRDDVWKRLDGFDLKLDKLSKDWGRVDA